MVIKIDWKKVGFKEYYNIVYGPVNPNDVTSCSIINIDEKEYFGPYDIHAFNNNYVQSKNIPFPKDGIVHMKMFNLNTSSFPDIENVFEFTERVLELVENTNKYEGSFGLELLDVGISSMAELDLNGNPGRKYKFERIL